MSEEMAKQVAALIRGRGVAIFSGAGLSTESGLMDFRSKDGIWAHADPTRLASVGVLESNYDEFLEFLQGAPLRARRGAAERRPQAHSRMGKARLRRRRHNAERRPPAPEGRLRQRLGAARKLEPVYCHSCGRPGDRDDFLAGKPCPHCGGHLRPSVVLFGEMLPQRALEAADELSRRCRTFIVLGSSLVVSPRELLPARGEDERSGARDNQP